MKKIIFSLIAILAIAFAVYGVWQWNHVDQPTREERVNP